MSKMYYLLVTENNGEEHIEYITEKQKIDITTEIFIKRKKLKKKFDDWNIYECKTPRTSSILRRFFIKDDSKK